MVFQPDWGFLPLRLFYRQTLEKVSYTDSNRKIIIIFLEKNPLKYLHISNKCIIFVVEKETTKTLKL